MAINFPNSPVLNEVHQVSDGPSWVWNGTTWDLIQQTSDNGADILVYTPAGTGAVATTVKAKLDTVISIKDFGAAGDGTTDDYVAVTAAINAGTGKTVDGGGATYRMDTAVVWTSQNVTVQNAVFDLSNMSDATDDLITFAGTEATPTLLTGNAVATASVLTVASTTTFTAEQYAWLESDTVWESGQTVLLGQYVKIKSVDSATQLTLYADLLYDFTTAANAQVSAVTSKDRITFRDCKFIGSNANHESALNFTLCSNVVVESCYFEFCDYVAVRVNRTVNFAANACTVRYARNTGTSYGFAVVNGSYSVRVANSYGEDLRHFVTVGDNDGVCLFVTVTGNHIYGCQDAGIDAHSACDFMVITSNTIEGASIDGGQLDGIICQGLNCVISNNLLVGIRRHAIFHQNLVDMGIGSTVITGNTILNAGGDAGAEAAINVTQAGTSVLGGVTITGNTAPSTICSYGIYLYGTTANVENVVISGNSMSGMTVNGIYLRIAATFTLNRVTVTGNALEGNSATGTGVYLLGTSTINLTNVTITGNVIDDFVFPIRASLCDEVIETGNILLNFTDPYQVETNCTNIRLDSRRMVTRTITNATDTLEEDDDYLIANRAGTVTLTLRGAPVFAGKIISLKTIQAQTVVSGASDVVPLIGGAAGTAILPATDGAWAELRSDGTSWIIMKSGT
jgi:hypothetical protein